LKKVQNYINNLDMESTSTTDFITSITQTDGKIAVTRAKAGTLVLGTQSTYNTVAAEDSLNAAINKLEVRIKMEEDNRKAAIDTLYGNNEETIAQTFDTIKEIADWLDADAATGDTGVEQLINSIATLEGGEETSGSVANSIKTAIEGLDVTDVADPNKYVSSVSEVNGKISVTRVDLPTYTLATGETNGTVKLNGAEASVKGLKSAAYTESTEYATAAQGTTAEGVANTIAGYGNIVTYNIDDFVSKEEYNALVEDYNALKALVDKLNKQVNPDSGEETPDEGTEEPTI
jgi:hypothetical protein